MNKRNLISSVGFLLATTLSAHAAVSEHAYAITTRPGVELPIVITADTSLTDRTAVKHVVLLFNGGAGGIRPADAQVKEGERGINLSLRGTLAEKVGVTVSVGLPTDRPNGLDLAFRASRPHVEDVGMVAAVLMKQYPEARLSLLGYSNGTMSAAHAGASWAKNWGKKLQGVILLAPFIDAFREPWIASIKDENKVPILVVHHRRDSCLTYKDIEDTARWHDFVTIDDPNQPRPTITRRDCGPGSAHQFANRESLVYAAVAEWIKTGKTTAIN